MIRKSESINILKFDISVIKVDLEMFTYTWMGILKLTINPTQFKKNVTLNRKSLPYFFPVVARIHSTIK